MPQKTVICRYCKEKFILPLNKPGYANECPDCLMQKLSELKPAATPIPRKSKSRSIQEKRDRERAEIEKARASVVASFGKVLGHPKATDLQKKEAQIIIKLLTDDIEDLRDDIEGLRSLLGLSKSADPTEQTHLEGTGTKTERKWALWLFPKRPRHRSC